MAAEKAQKRDIYSKTWITEKSIGIINRYEKGVLTLRALHYQLVAIGMTNTLQHYKRVVNALIDARWDGLVEFDAFSDHDREVLGETRWEETDLDTEVDKAEDAIKLWMRAYYKNRWENQPYYPEVWINGKEPIILYFGDYDASGEDIPRSIEENFTKFGVPVEVKRIALKEEQVVEWKLPHAPTKVTDARAANWDGFGQVELDAVDMNKLRNLCSDAISEIFDQGLNDELRVTEAQERREYRTRLQEFVNDQFSSDEDEDNDE